MVLRAKQDSTTEDNIPGNLTVLFKNMGMAAEVTSIIADICDGVSSNVIFPLLNTGVPLTSNIAWPPMKNTKELFF